MVRREEKIVYQDIQFPQIKKRLYIFTNHVSTIDGIAKVLLPGSYWPIGSELDFKIYTSLREYADVIIQGRETASGYPTLKTIRNQGVNEKRKLKGKKPLLYVVVSNNPDEKLLNSLKDPGHTETLLVTSQKSLVPDDFLNITKVMRIGEEKVNVVEMCEILYKKGYEYGYAEGGPRLLWNFLESGIIDEVFATIAPKIYGHSGKTITMIEGGTLSSKNIAEFNLISVSQQKDELFLRYRKHI